MLFKSIKNKLKKLSNTIKILIMFTIVIILFLLYSQTQKIYFEKANDFVGWLQFNSNGVLVLLGSMVTIISVIMSINHSDKTRDKIELNNAKKDLCILERKVNVFLNYINNDLNCLGKRLVNVSKNLYELNNFRLEKDIVDDIVILTVSSEILFGNCNSKKVKLKNLRNDVIEILEIERKAYINGKWDKYLLKNKLEVYDKYLYEEYRSFINVLFEKRLNFDDNKCHLVREELLEEVESFKEFKRGFSMLTKLDEINFSFIKEIDV